MPRMPLAAQPDYEFTHSLTVRATDVNHAGHLGNEALLGLVHEARAHFLKQLGFDPMVGAAHKVGLIIADLVVNFKTEAFAYDLLQVDCQIDEIQEKSFRLFHRVRRGEQVIALVETGMVAYDYTNKKAVPIPDEFLVVLKNSRSEIRK